MAERLFHLVPPEAWSAASAHASWSPPSLAREGFVHLSYSHQLAGTSALHFEDHQQLWLLELDPASLGAQLVVEASRGGALFPHLYRALGREEVLGHWELFRTRDGEWRLPQLCAEAGDDQPRRRAGAPPG